MFSPSVIYFLLYSYTSFKRKKKPAKTNFRPAKLCAVKGHAKCVGQGGVELRAVVVILDFWKKSVVSVGVQVELWLNTYLLVYSCIRWCAGRIVA